MSVKALITPDWVSPFHYFQIFSFWPLTMAVPGVKDDPENPRIDCG